MYNLYSVIIGLFCLSGGVLAFLTWIKIKKKKSSVSWPTSEGWISESAKPSADTEYQPRIIYKYLVDGKEYQNPIELTHGESAMPDFSERFLTQYPVGMKLTVYYDPQRPEISELTVGPSREDWAMFYIGIGAMVTGLGFILLNI